MSAFFTAFLPLLLRILGMIIDKYVSDKEAKAQFLKLVNALEMGGITSVKLSKSYREQIEQMRGAKSDIM